MANMMNQVNQPEKYYYHNPNDNVRTKDNYSNTTNNTGRSSSNDDIRNHIKPRSVVTTTSDEQQQQQRMQSIRIPTDDVVGVAATGSTTTTTVTTAEASSSSSSNNNNNNNSEGILLDISFIDEYLFHQLVRPIKQIIQTLVSMYTANNNNNNNNNTSSSTSTDNNNHDDFFFYVFSSSSILLDFILQSTIHLITLFWTNGQTPAMKLFGLQLSNNKKPIILIPTLSRRAENNSNKKKNAQQLIIDQQEMNHYQPLTKHRLITYAVLRIVIPTVYKIFKEWLARTLLYQQHQELLSTHTRQNGLVVQTNLQDRNPQQPNDHDYNDHVEEAEAEAEAERQQLLIHIRRKKLERIKWLLRIIETKIDGTVLPIIQLITLLLFWSGKINNAPPDLAMILSKLKYTATTSTTQQQYPLSETSQRLHVDYAYRRWYYHVAYQAIMTLFSGCTLIYPVLYQPYIQQHIIRPMKRILRKRYILFTRHLQHTFVPFVKSVFFSKKQLSDETKTNNDKTNYTSNDLCCSLCHGTPIIVPCITYPCEHIYCYICLYQEASTSKSFCDCVECGQRIQSARVL